MSIYITIAEAASRCSVGGKHIKNLLAEGRIQGVKKRCKTSFRWHLVDAASLDRYMAERRQVTNMQRSESAEAAQAARQAMLEYCQTYLATYGKHAPISDVMEHTGLTVNQVKHMLGVFRREGLLPYNRRQHSRIVRQPNACRRCGLIDESLSRGLCRFCREEEAGEGYHWYELNTEPVSSWREGVLER